jgi:thioredoxin-related protein
VLFEADSPSMYSKDEYLGKLVTRQFTPVFIFLDHTGKKVLEMAGFRNPREAKALHEFISKRHYVKRSWQDFLAAYPQ